MVDFFEHVKKIWSLWEIRVLIICSLTFQIILILSAPFRKRRQSKWVSPFIWACYLLADWVATFSLGLISKNQGSDDNSDCLQITQYLKLSSSTPNHGTPNTTNNDLRAFWAPFLLLHLGGPDTITAFSLEDNELWLRHLLGLLFEVFAAGYVFFYALPMKRLLAPMLLMFVAGIIKYAERTYALYLASMNGFRDSLLGEPEPGPNYAKLMGEYSSKEESGVEAKIEIIKEPETPFALIEEEEKNLGEVIKDLNDMKKVELAHLFYMKFRGLIANLIFSFKEREWSRKFFLKLSPKQAFEVIDIELGFIYEVLYTKATVVHSRMGYGQRVFCTSLILASLFLFKFTKKHDYGKFDITVTYVLLIGAIFLDFVAFIMLILSDWTIVSLGGISSHCQSVVSGIRDKLPIPGRPKWSNLISQYNLIDCCRRKQMKYLNVFSNNQTIEYYIRTHQVPVDEELKECIFEELKRKSKFAKDAKTTKELCSCRGDWVLKHHEIDFQDLLHWSVEKEFDEILLLWHIATDLCYNTNLVVNDVNERTHKEISNNLSNYMLYLLVMQPTMMSSMAGIGPIRFRDTCAEAKIFFSTGKSKLDAHTMLRKVYTEIKPADVKGDKSKSVLFDSVRLSKQLNKLPQNKKWKMISEVWVELLSYAASHCKGVAHATLLSKGGELLTFVWFLMVHLGLGEQFCIEAGHAKARLIVEI